MAQLTEINRFIAESLEFDRFEEADTSLNGLQVEGNSEVTRIAAAVDAGIAVIEGARAAGADLLLVHHGVFWGKPVAIVGAHREAVSLLLNAGMSLLAAHLPLDAHPAFGNNFSLGRLLELESLCACAEYHGCNIGVRGINTKLLKLDYIVERLAKLSGAPESPAVILPFGPQVPERIEIVSGAGAEVLREYAAEGFDTLITGEPRQFAYHFAREHRLNVIFAGHYATETLGVQNLAQAIADKFSITWQFIDHPTGI